jgi:hypothetical protein
VKKPHKIYTVIAAVLNRNRKKSAIGCADCKYNIYMRIKAAIENEVLT